MLAPDDSVQNIWETKYREGFRFAVACALLALAARFVSRTELSWSTVIKLGLFGTYTVATFGLFISKSRAMWKLAAFWLFLSLATFLHAVLFVVAERYIPYWPVVCVLLVIGELAGLVYARDVIFVRQSVALRREAKRLAAKSPTVAFNLAEQRELSVWGQEAGFDGVRGDLA